MGPNHSPVHDTLRSEMRNEMAAEHQRELRNMAEAEQSEDWYVNGNTDFDPVVEVWESYGGDLWFITDPNGNTGFGYARLSAMPQFAEWGTINRAELVNNGKIWQVDKDSWQNINTYEDGLLQKV